MDVGCQRLAASLEPLTALTSLDLSHNPFGEVGCGALANLLSRPACQLLSLAVSGCLNVDPCAWKTIDPLAMAKKAGKESEPWVPPRPGDDGGVLLAAALMSPHGCPLRYTRL